VRNFIIFNLFFVTYAANSSEWQVAITKIKTKLPSQITELPTHVKNVLTKENCKIPTGEIGTSTPKELAKVKGWTKGSFSKIGQTDWAVVCVYDKFSKIKIVWGGSNTCKASTDFKEPLINNIYGGNSGQGQFFYFHRDLSIHRAKKLDALVELNDKGGENHFCSNGIWTTKSEYH